MRASSKGLRAYIHASFSAGLAYSMHNAHGFSGAEKSNGQLRNDVVALSGEFISSSLRTKVVENHKLSDLHSLPYYLSKHILGINFPL